MKNIRVSTHHKLTALWLLLAIVDCLGAAIAIVYFSV